uniref:Uncharacterized protein n=1 Tax=viral metagenome TaxID=1070528 RepID=A0A6C0DCI2_9ZZZZ
MTSVAKTYQNTKFDPTNFNKNFEDNDIGNNRNINLQNNLEEEDMKIILLPHKQPVENIILNIRDLFFEILNRIENKENPLPFIFSSNNRQFAFSIFLIIFGTLLLLLATLMKSPYET